MKSLLMMMLVTILAFVATDTFAQGVKITDSDGVQTVLKYEDITQVYPNNSDKAVILYGSRYTRYVSTSDFTDFVREAGSNLLLFTDANYDDRSIAIPVGSILRITENSDNTARIFQEVPNSNNILSYDVNETFAAINETFAAYSYGVDMVTGGSVNVDTTYRSSALTIAEDATDTLSLAGHISYLDQLPGDLDSLISVAGSTILADSGDIVLLTVMFSTDANTANATWIDVEVTAGATTYAAAPTIALPKGQDVSQNYSFTTSFMADANFQSNGGVIAVTAGGDALDVSGDITVTVTRVKKSNQ